MDSIDFLRDLILVQRANPETIPTFSPQRRVLYGIKNLSRRPGNHLLVGTEHYFKQLITPFSCSIMLLMIIKHLFPRMHQHLCSAVLRCGFAEKYMGKFRLPLSEWFWIYCIHFCGFFLCELHWTFLWVKKNLLFSLLLYSWGMFPKPYR